MKPALPLLAPATVPRASFTCLTALWIQITGTWCDLECAHCLNASGPREPRLPPMAATAVRAALRQAEALGVKEIYFTGGEPFLHRDLAPLLGESLALAPTTVLTNGTLVTSRIADRLALLAREAPYSLEIRVSLDDVDEALNDRVRGRGAWAGAVRAIRLLDARGLLPIVTATEILDGEHPGRPTYERFRDFLRSIGIVRPRVKVIPVFPVGRLEGGPPEPLTEEALQGFDREQLQCAETRVVAADGVYACPILAGQPGARLATESLEASFVPAPLYHQACAVCHRTGMTCRNG